MSPNHRALWETPKEPQTDEPSYDSDGEEPGLEGDDTNQHEELDQTT